MRAASSVNALLRCRGDGMIDKSKTGSGTPVKACR